MAPGRPFAASAPGNNPPLADRCAAASLTSSIRKEPFQNLLVQVVGLQAPAVHPLTQTGDRPQFSPPRVDRIAMRGQVLRKSIQIATQRTDTQSLAGGIGAEIVVHGVFSSADRA